MEVASQRNKHIGCGIMIIVFDKGSTLFDFDHRLHQCLFNFDKSYPVNRIGIHACCPIKSIFKILKPIVFALCDKHCRSRIVLHDVHSSKLYSELSEYGILKCMIPREMGGTLEFDQLEWIADRRAAELDEI